MFWHVIGEKFFQRGICIYSILFRKSTSLFLDIPDACKLTNVVFQNMLRVPAAHSAVADAGRSPRTTAILMALLGAALTAGVFVVLFLLDDTIRTDEDVERYLGLSTLGIIPISAELETAKQPGEGTPRKGILGVPKSKR